MGRNGTEDTRDLTDVQLTIMANNGKSWYPLFHSVECQ